ncbi:MAG: PEP-CTERM sorting domain-containing protein [Janthinobacterium lividum]
MRFRVIALSCVMIAVSAGGVKTLAASPDCARWVREYQQGLAKRAVLARKHVVHAARHLGVPRAHMVRTGAPVHRLRPARLSPQEMLKRFRVLCGEDLPEDAVPVSFVPTSLDALLIPPAIFPDNVAPITDITGPVSFVPGTPGVTTGTPVGTVPPNSSVPIVTPGIPIGATPGVPVTTTPVPPIETPSPVPEPGSLLLMMTGVLGVIAVVLRRRRPSAIHG